MEAYPLYIVIGSGRQVAIERILKAKKDTKILKPTQESEDKLRGEVLFNMSSNPQDLYLMERNHLTDEQFVIVTWCAKEKGGRKVFFIDATGTKSDKTIITLDGPDTAMGMILSKSPEKTVIISEETVAKQQAEDPQKSTKDIIYKLFFAGLVDAETKTIAVYQSLVGDDFEKNIAHEFSGAFDTGIFTMKSLFTDKEKKEALGRMIAEMEEKPVEQTASNTEPSQPQQKTLTIPKKETVFIWRDAWWRKHFPKTTFPWQNEWNAEKKNEEPEKPVLKRDPQATQEALKRIEESKKVLSDEAVTKGYNKTEESKTT